MRTEKLETDRLYKDKVLTHVGGFHSQRLSCFWTKIIVEQNTTFAAIFFFYKNDVCLLIIRRNILRINKH